MELNKPIGTLITELNQCLEGSASPTQEKPSNRCYNQLMRSESLIKEIISRRGNTAIPAQTKQLLEKKVQEIKENLSKSDPLFGKIMTIIKKISPSISVSKKPTTPTGRSTTRASSIKNISPNIPASKKPTTPTSRSTSRALSAPNSPKSTPEHKIVKSEVDIEKDRLIPIPEKSPNPKFEHIQYIENLENNEVFLVSESNPEESPKAEPSDVQQPLQIISPDEETLIEYINDDTPRGNESR